MLAPRLIASYRFFRGKTGMVGHDAESALALACAEQLAKDADCTWEWVNDDDGWHELSRDNYLCSCGCGHRIESCEGCILRDGNGEVLASLWGIWDASEEYRRIVQAELALEAQEALLSYAI